MTLAGAVFPRACCTGGSGSGGGGATCMREASPAGFVSVSDRIAADLAGAARVAFGSRPCGATIGVAGASAVAAALGSGTTTGSTSVTSDTAGSSSGVTARGVCSTGFGSAGRVGFPTKANAVTTTTTPSVAQRATRGRDLGCGLVSCELEEVRTIRSTTRGFRRASGGASRSAADPCWARVSARLQSLQRPTEPPCGWPQSRHFVTCSAASVTGTSSSRCERSSYPLGFSVETSACHPALAGQANSGPTCRRTGTPNRDASGRRQSMQEKVRTSSFSLLCECPKQTRPRPRRIISSRRSWISGSPSIRT